MFMTRRKAIKLIAASIPALSAARALGVEMRTRAGICLPALWKQHALWQEMASGPKIARGPFQGTRESLRAYKIPNGSPMRNLAFGRIGGRNRPSNTAIGTRAPCICRALPNTNIMSNITPSVEVWLQGHDSVWKAEKFDPDFLVVSTKRRREILHEHGVHHDNFDLWIQIHALESVKMGPKRDIVVNLTRDAISRIEIRR